MEGQISSNNALDQDITVRPWADLLLEILSLISDSLGLVELLAFRGVCKNWRVATSTASAKSESAKGLEPSLLYYGASDEKCYFNYQESKTYSINIPALNESICLASNYGWLLLAKQQEQSSLLFFFCPFSRAKIELPEFPGQSEISDHIASFSAPPTSSDCILVVAHLSKSLRIKLHQLHRGSRKWTSEEFFVTPMGALSGACYLTRKRYFYFTDRGERVIKVSTKDQETILKTYHVVTGTSEPRMYKTLPFRYKEDKFLLSNMKDNIGALGNYTSISTCGTYFLMTDNVEVVIMGEEVKLSIPESEEENTKFSQLKGIWIHPRFHQIPPNQCCW